jgi:hypothetical protein
VGCLNRGEAARVIGSVLVPSLERRKALGGRAMLRVAWQAEHAVHRLEVELAELWPACPQKTFQSRNAGSARPSPTPQNVVVGM